MIVQIIPTRYTVSGKVLYDCLEEKFGVGKVQVIELDDGENWKIQVPRELTDDEQIEVIRKCQKKRRARTSGSAHSPTSPISPT
ncbi:uncharacterized protein DSM5745_04517 [Aspergillus mulundensis]|uniref:Uncharacterized protein n=1 Tax=Aspergillus mulundensis TaxID=1810919 RepID=A0A3D8SDE3_9EURO|nr:hypothetical protein DSM5745_04517 [Aspergillus mulundensis]RDW84191.1 hypothetical protein DSM5745_04517 [Aspergillus mulundensis]